MREFRSGSQILFGHLPDQTIDADGGIWQVRRWNDPIPVTTIDVPALRDELIRAAYSWRETGLDGGFVDDLYAQRNLVVLSVNRDRGVWCEPFPRLYLCQYCKRLHDTPEGQCECGSKRRRGQLPFVGYHEECGAIKTPYVQKCKVHGQRALRAPGTASAAELVFYCPVCNAIIQRGFGASCDCSQGGVLKFNVHRSGVVFKPRSISMINPPKREILKLIDQAGGGERALEWVLGGMVGRNLTDSAAPKNPDSIRKILEERGFDAATIDAMIMAMPPTQAKAGINQFVMDLDTKSVAERESRQIALATFESRLTLNELLKKTTEGGLAQLYKEEYPAALARAGIERVELIDRFPILTAQFGYTRGPSSTGASRLRTYRERNGDYNIYGDLSESEALLIRLDPCLVNRWLIQNGEVLPQVSDKRGAAEVVLSAMNVTDQENRIYQKILVLIHSFSHALIKRAAVYAGIERNSLSELILPTSFSFFIYAAPRGDFVLGGLQALLETDLHHLLNGLVDDEHRCALDPGCEDTGAACAVCLHLGEPSCKLFNTNLSRKVLAGGAGYFDISTSSLSN